MPPKPKLSKGTGKAAFSPSKNKATNMANGESSSDSSLLPINENPQLQEQFEVELCWCVQQLQRTLNSGKLNEKQVQENKKVLNTLMSNSTSFVKKRQVMRISFGDYRAKMAEENKKLAKGLNMRISQTSPNIKSQFIKKSLLTSQPDFKFNFNVETAENNLEENLSQIQINTDTPSEPFHFTNSKNNFRFNFS